jgi:hypothetical protein
MALSNWQSSFAAGKRRGATDNRRLSPENGVEQLAIAVCRRKTALSNWQSSFAAGKRR